MKKFSNKLFIGTFIGLLISNQAQSINPKDASKPTKLSSQSGNCRTIALKNSSAIFTLCMEGGNKTPSLTPAFISALTKNAKELVRQHANSIKKNKNNTNKTNQDKSKPQPNTISNPSPKNYGEEDFDFDYYDIGGDTLDIDIEGPNNYNPDFSSPNPSSPDPSRPDFSSPMNPNTAPANSGTTNPNIYPLNML